MNTLELDNQLNALIIQGKSVDAFQKFYAEDVVAQENDEPERVGRDAWMRGRQEMEKNIKKFNARVLANAANGDTSFSEWQFDIELEGIVRDQRFHHVGGPVRPRQLLDWPRADSHR